jgi:3-polyprenyl-4-hydroxybenzoate decarboxylase
MSAASNYLELKVLDHVLKYATAPYVAPTTLYVALFKNTSGNAATNLEAGTLTDEISTSGTAYARQTITFASASSGSSATNATVTFPTATASFGTITHVAIVDGATAGAGNVLFWGAVTTSKTIDTGDTFSISSGNLTVSLA